MTRETPLFIAEVSSNHNQELDRCLQFIRMATQIGCDGIKFQFFRIEALFAPEVLEASEDHRRRAQWELPAEYLPKLSRSAREAGLLFGCTPFDLDGVDQLEPLVDFFKIASYELLWLDLIEKCGSTNKPVVLSTGMADIDEVQTAVKVVRGTCKELILLHCVSGYPTPVHQSNLSAIQTLRNRFGCPVGWSDHTGEKAVVLRALYKWGASLVEFHLDLDKSGYEYQQGLSWLPEDAADLIHTARLGRSADGSGVKSPLPLEQAEREWRTDPSDGLRPLRSVRRSLRETRTLDRRTDQ